MARLARIVIPGIAHHVTQRGNRRQRVFFRDEDFRLYLALLKEWSCAFQLTILAYCLMPNHVHVVCIPSNALSLHKVFRETHRRYTSTINLREGWRGYLWQGRFSSFPMDERYTWAALRYVESNPVRAGLVAAAEQWEWSSAHSPTHDASDRLRLSDSLPSSFDIPSEFFRRHERTGRPLGDQLFIQSLEQATGRSLLPKKRGPKSRTE